MRELQRGLPRLVEIDSTDLWRIVGSEIMQSKVDLIMGDEAEQMRKEIALREAEDSDADKKGDKASLPKPAEEAKS